jgi:hypothetical protein
MRWPVDEGLMVTELFTYPALDPKTLRRQVESVFAG